MDEPLRPSTLGEILDRTVQLYRRNFLLFAGSAAPPSVVMVGGLIVFVAGLGYFARFGAGGLKTHNLAVGILAIVMLVVLVPLEIGATVVSQAALVRAGISANLGQKLRIREALKSVWPRFWRYFLLLFLEGIAVVLIPGLIAGAAILATYLLARLAGEGPQAMAATMGLASFLFIAAASVAIVLLLLRFSLSMPICVSEQKTAWQSMKRSLKLSKGTRGRIFLMFFLVWVLSVIASMVAYIPLMIAVAVVSALVHAQREATLVIVIAEAVNVLVNFVIQVLVTPFYATALVLFYFDQRIRTEAYDIEWMMEQAGLTDTHSPAAGGAPGTGAIASGTADGASMGIG
jgi:membrane-anchored glycerophosphoryl diester phosphodiesterase (GDPDase)